MKILRFNFIFIITLYNFNLLFNPAVSLAEIYHLTILHTNDHHGHFAEFSLPGNPGVGGMAARSTLVNIVRAEVENTGGHVLFLSAGDVNIGTPESDLLNGEPDFKLMKMLDYDAMVIGNHEFSNPFKVLMQQREWAGFPFLSANVVHEKTGKYLFDPYIIKEFNGLKVAIFGLTEEREGGTIITNYIDNININNVIETAKALVPKLKKEADLVVALSDTESSGLRWTGSKQLAQAVPTIDVIVSGGPDIQTEAKVIGKTLIVQAGEYGLHVGRLDLNIDHDANKIIDYSYTLIPVNIKKKITYKENTYYTYEDRGYVEDPAVLEFIEPYLENVKELLSQPVGESKVKLIGEKEIIRTQETNLANLITDSMRAKTDAEISFFNAGGIRASIEAGVITYRDILRVLPFGDTMVLLDMTGSQIMEVINYAATMNSDQGGFLHASGLSWTNKKGIPEDVLVSGDPIDLNRTYKVVANSFIVRGGDGYVMFRDLPQYDTGFVDASVLHEFIKKKGSIDYKVEGRLTIID